MSKVKWLMIIMISLALLGFGEQCGKFLLLENEKTVLLEEKATLAQENKALQEELKLLYDVSYIETLAREKLSMVYPGEKKYVKADYNNRLKKNANIEGDILD